jgi:hypothetical protein
MRKVIDPAVLQVNGLSDMSVAIEQRRRHSRAPVHEFALTWWKKEGDEFRTAMAERNRSKVGRMARLKNQVEKVEALQGERIAAAHAELGEMPAAMRRQGKKQQVS